MTDWKSIVKTVAPVLGTALGGPMGGLATRVIAGVLLGDENADETAIEAAITGATPSDLLKLKQADLQFKADMKKLDVDVYKAELRDRRDARGLAKVNMLPHIWLSSLFIGGYFSTLAIIGYYVFGTNAPPPDATLLQLFTLVFGVVTGAIPLILQFWFGSSTGSKEKTGLIEQMQALMGKGNAS